MDPYLVTMLLTCTALQLPLPTHVCSAPLAMNLSKILVLWQKVALALL